jgi:cytochrome P450
LNPLTFGHALLEFAEQPGVTEQDLVSEIEIIFIAGHETTAHTMSWFVYSLATNEEVQARCHAAVDADYQAVRDPKTAVQLPQYVEAVLRESMRRYPMLSRGSARVVRQPEGVTIPLEVLNMVDPLVPARHPPFTQEVHLPRGTWCQVHFNNIMSSVDNWGPGAKQFGPERFLPRGHYLGGAQVEPDAPNNPLSSQAVYMGGGVTGHDLSFLPFSHGPRNCIGMNLALQEMRTVLRGLVDKFSFALADETLRDEGVALESVLTLRPHKMLPVYVTKRVK